MKFREKWLEAVEKKNSVLCAGLDPAEFDMGRGDKGLSQDSDKAHWAIDYITAVASYAAALKLNIQYWKNSGDMGSLRNIVDHAHNKGLVVIEDSKLADIGSTNDAGIYYSQRKGFDAITFSPFAGNIEEAVKQAHDRNLGLFSMVLMSNPEYAREKTKLVEISNEQTYYKVDIQTLYQKNYIQQYVHLAKSSQNNNVDGIVIGAPSEKNHINEREIESVRRNVTENMLVLLPGVGAQGGEADAIWKYFRKDNVIVNVSRGLMFPNGSNSTPSEQAETAKQYRDMLNQLRQAA